MIGVTGIAAPSGMMGEAKYLTWNRRKIHTAFFGGTWKRPVG